MKPSQARHAQELSLLPAAFEPFDDVLSGTGGRSETLHDPDAVVGVNLGIRDGEDALQDGQKIAQSLQLGGRRLLEIKIAKQKNSNVAPIELQGAGMSPDPVKVAPLPETPERVDDIVIADVIPAATK